MPKRKNGELNAFRKAIHQALRSWNSVDARGLERLQSSLLFQRAWSEYAPLDPVEWRQKANRVILEVLDELGVQQPFSAKVLRRRFIENKTITELALQHNLSPDQLNRRQREAIEQLCMILWGREQRLRRKRLRAVQQRLPPRTFGRLLAIDAELQQLQTFVAAEKDPGVLALVGQGGLGKTALAQSLLRRMAEQSRFQQFHWIGLDARDIDPQQQNVLGALAERLLPNSNRADSFSALHKVLKRQAQLIVVDGVSNLDLELAATLHELAGPSKFLLTSRQRPPSTAQLRQFELQPRGPSETQLMLNELATNLRPGIAIGRHADAIRELTGGNPLALKLILQHLQSLPLAEVLDIFRRAASQDVEDCFLYVYADCWRTLSPAAKNLLHSLAQQAKTPASFAELGAHSKLPRAALRMATLELANNCLIEIRGPVEDPRYRLRRLTRTFVLSGLTERL